MGEKWLLLLVMALVGIIFLFFLAAISGPSPAHDISTTSFNCREWVGASLSSSTENGFSVSFEGKNISLVNIETTGKQFHHYSANCNPGCAYLGKIEPISFAGNFVDKPSDFGLNTTAVSDNSGVFYRCAGREGA